MAIVYVYLLWRDAASVEEHPAGDRPTPHATRLLFLLAFLCGLSLAHMLTIAFIVPPLVVVILWQRPDLLRSPKAIVGSVIAAALPLLAYAFVYVRGAAHPEWWGQGDWPNARAWFCAFLSTAQGREELGWGFEPGAAFFGNGFPELIWQELSLPLLILGLLGILLFDRKLATLLYGTIGLDRALQLGLSLRQLVSGDPAGLPADSAGQCRRRRGMASGVERPGVRRAGATRARRRK